MVYTVVCNEGLKIGSINRDLLHTVACVYLALLSHPNMVSGLNLM